MVKYNNRFFKTREEAKAFQKENGGVIYSHVPYSRTKRDFLYEMAVALDARGEIVDKVKTPFCVAWNEVS